jgi:tetratricopeptide (TPR) repeat protein
MTYRMQSTRSHVALCFLTLLAVCACTGASPKLRSDEDLEDRLAKANLLLENGEVRDAFEAYSAILKNMPNQEPALRGRAKALLKAGQCELALRDIDQLLRLAPGDKTLHRYRGDSLLGMNRPTSALKEYRLALEANGSDDIAREAVTRISDSLSEGERLLSGLNAAIDSRPTDSRKRLQRMRMYHKLEKYEEALAETDVIIRLQPTDPKSYLWRALIEIDTGRYDSALRDLEKAAEYGGEEESLSGRVIIATRQQNPTEYAVLIEQLRVKYPDSPLLKHAAFFLPRNKDLH